MKLALKALLLGFGLSISVAHAQTEAPETSSNYTVLRSFPDGKFSAVPFAPLIADKAGNFYGTASAGGNTGCVVYGSTGCGTVFKLSPPTKRGGAWTETVLYAFPGGSGPWFPMAGLTMDAAGNFFGITTDSLDGASYDCVPGDYCGTAFELSPPAGPAQGWREINLYRFNPVTDGVPSFSGLVPDGKGDFFGTTCTGGPANMGTVFELQPPSKKGAWWKKSVLSDFHSAGNCPSGNVVLDKAGNIYGTTFYGGPLDLGLAYMLTAPAAPSRQWTQTVIYEFGNDTCYPQTNLIFDKKGNLYGTTRGCPALPGAVFELSPLHKSGQSWTETGLAYFYGPDVSPQGLILDKAGTLYGTTANGGTYGHGTLFKLKPSAGHGGGHPTTWSQTILHSFSAKGGYVPGAGPIFGPDGALYGTTISGGYQRGVCHVAGCGVAYKAVP